MRIQIAAAVLAAIMGTSGVVTPQDAYAAENKYVEVTPEDAAESNTEEAADTVREAAKEDAAEVITEEADETIMEAAEESATEAITEETTEENTQEIPQLGVKAGEVVINEDSFPDEIFRSYVASKFDADGDGVLSQAEIKAVTGITVWSKGISSLKGIEYFVNLIDLNCLGNSLSQLDVSKNVNLTSLVCDGNDLIQLDVSRNADLTFLSCYNNNLSQLDVSKNVHLMSLFCQQNRLSQLDVSRNVNLTSLFCQQNSLSELDVSKNVNLTSLSCYSNRLSRLEVSKNVNLTSLSCASNRLSQLDVSRNVNLTDLSCASNRLSRLDVRKNVNLSYLSCYKNNLSRLDVSRNINLMNLLCGSNKLSELDVSRNVDLSTFSCASNRLSQLDVSKNMNLMNLECSNNSSNNIIMNKGQSFRFSQVVNSSQKSSNTKSVVINKDGKVSAIRSGTAIVTVRDVKGVKSSYTVTVTEAGAYKITYKLNGGRNASGNPATYRSKAVKLKSPTRKGCIFKGWYQTAEFKGKITAIAPSLKKHLTVYAKWEKVKVGKSAVTGLKNLSGKKAKVSIKKVSGAKGYEVVYSIDKRLKKGKKTITVKKNTAILRKLKKNKRYYVKCRAYKLDSTGKKVYGKYSAVKNVRIRK